MLFTKRDIKETDSTNVFELQTTFLWPLLKNCFSCMEGSALQLIQDTYLFEKTYTNRREFI